MSATAMPPKDVADYLERVRAQLADLPAEERDELMADVESSLLDAASDSVVPLAEQLGPPERFAGELRAAAGLAPRPGAATAHEPLSARLRGVARELSERTRDLAPLWWVARGYIAVAALALLIDSQWSIRLAALPKLVPDAEASAVIVLAAMSASVWIGRRFGRRMLAVDALLVVVAIPVLVHISNPPGFEGQYMYYEFEAPTPVSHFSMRVDNLYAYDRQGRLLQDVRIYDNVGRPMNIGARRRSADPHRRRVRTTTGAVALNAFPIRYFERGTRRVERPSAGPQIDVLPLATRPLRAAP